MPEFCVVERFIVIVDCILDHNGRYWWIHHSETKKLKIKIACSSNVETEIRTTTTETLIEKTHLTLRSCSRSRYVSSLHRSSSVLIESFKFKITRASPQWNNVFPGNLLRLRSWSHLQKHNKTAAIEPSDIPSVGNTEYLRTYQLCAIAFKTLAVHHWNVGGLQYRLLYILK